jgi:glycerophosphoryl diester phosphodiesterase
MTTLPDSFRTTPIAHRALHDITQGRPENSRAAIKAAIDHGYGIEIDLQVSQDDQAMVFHDYDLRRLTVETGPVRLRSATDLQDISLTGGTDGIPTLAEVLDLVRGQVPLLIELKDQDGAMGPNIGALEDATAALLTGYQGPVAVMSFNPHSVAYLANRLPTVPRGLTTAGYDADDWPTLSADIRDHLRPITDFDRCGCSFISHDAKDLNAPAVAALKDRGVPVLCWTIRSPEAERQARLVADNITFEGYLATHP